MQEPYPHFEVSMPNSWNVAQNMNNEPLSLYKVQTGVLFRNHAWLLKSTCAMHGRMNWKND